MTLAELKGRYARLSVEIDALADAAGHSQAKLARLSHELDEIDREFVAFRRRAAAAPTLHDVVSWIEPFAPSRMGAANVSAAAPL